MLQVVFIAIAKYRSVSIIRRETSDLLQMLVRTHNAIAITLHFRSEETIKIPNDRFTKALKLYKALLELSINDSILSRRDQEHLA